jgi:prepilin-type N-terminal cleavage/methylation domain-containing protein
MDLRKDKRGFSLVELIIVMGIMAVFAGGIFGALGYINQGKTKKAAATLNSELTSIQQSNMTLKGATYLYLYQDGGTIYMVTARASDVNGDGEIDKTPNTKESANYTSRTALNGYVSDNGGQGKLCSSKVEVIGIDGGDSTTLTDDNMIRIGYSKSTGAFTYCDMGKETKDDDVTSLFFNTIKLKGTETFTVKLVKNTGKHFVE